MHDDPPTIVVRIRACDGVSTRTFRTLAGAQRYACRMLGTTPARGLYGGAIRPGVHSLSVTGATLAALFPGKGAP